MGDGQRVELGDGATSRGEPQAGQRVAVSRRVGQAIAAEARSRHRRAPMAAAERGARLADVGRIDAGLGGKGDEQRFVGGQIVEHAGQEARLARGGANLGRADAGDGEEAAEPLARRRR